MGENGIAVRFLASRRAAEREPASLLQRVRHLFLVFSVLGLAVMLVFDEGGAVTGLAEAAALTVIAACLVRLTLRRHPELVTDALLVGALASIALVHEGRTLDLLFSVAFLIVNSRALYGSRRGVFATAAAYLVVLNLHAFSTGNAAAAAADAIIPNAGMLLPAWLMSTLAAVLRRHEETIVHERVLQAVGHELIAGATREETYQRALTALDGLASCCADARTGLWTRTGDLLELVAGDGVRPGEALRRTTLGQIPGEVAAALLAGRTVALDIAGTARVRQHLEFADARVETLAVPVMQRSELRAVLVITQPRLSPGLTDAVERLAVTVAMALDRSDAEALLAGVIESSSDTIAVVGADGRFLLLTPAVERTFGFHESDLEGEPLSTLLHADDAARILAGSGTADAGVGQRLECRARHAHGGTRSTEITVSQLTRSDLGTGLVLGIRDVTERKALEAEIAFRAFHDPLTGLVNRVLFADRVRDALERSTRSGRSLAVAFLDIDDFKTINDSLGHLAGDELLRVVASRIRTTLRDADTAARMGGDEFALLLEDLPDDESAIDVLSRVLTALRRPYDLGSREMVVSASAGLRIVDAADTTVDELLRDADLAMYHAKSQGKDCLEIFEPSMHTTALERLDLRADLQVALERSEFTLAFQPVVALPHATPVGVEALLRWRHPERGLIMPDAFIATAEQLGVLLPVGRWVIGEVCRRLREWDEAVPSHELTMAVNLSLRQLHDPLLCETVKAALDANGLAPHRLALEITEQTVMVDREASAAVLARLRDLGVRLAVDDFGDGYSSLGYLRTLPLDILKIDKTFIDATREGGNGVVLTQVILTLARRLGLTAVAEGIEHREQADDLAAWGCPQGQGFLFARPLDADELVDYLRTAQPAALDPRPAG